MRPLWHLAAVCLLLFAAGCGRQSSKPPQTYAVRGKVFLPDGRPLSSGTIVFHAKQWPGNDAMSLVDKDGSFALGTFAKDDGAIPGEYVVTVAPAARSAGGIPKKFLDEDLSPWKVTVNAADNQLATFTLR